MNQDKILQDNAELKLDIDSYVKIANEQAQELIELQLNNLRLKNTLRNLKPLVNDEAKASIDMAIENF